MTSPATASATTSAFSMYMTQNPTTIAILESLQGWLNKKKNPEEYKNKIFRYSGSEYNKRWFKIIEMKGFDEIELAIAYCGSQYDKEPKGWIYLKDVRMITDDTEIFTLLSPQRKLVLEAPTKAEHKLWLQGLVDLCHNADLTGINSLITLPSKNKIVDAKTVAPAPSAPAKAADERPINGTLLVNSKQLDNSFDFAAADEKSVNSDGSSNTPKKKILNNRDDKEDHRLSNFRPGHTTSASTRLHGHIRPGAVATATASTNSKILQLTDKGGAVHLSANSRRAGIEYKDDFDSIEVLDITKPVDSNAKKATFGKLRRQLNEHKRSSGDRDRDSGSTESDSGIVSSTTSSPAQHSAASPDSFMGLEGRRRPSVDDLLRSSPKLKINFDGFGDDEVDMKEERARYGGSHSTNNSKGSNNSSSSGRGAYDDVDAREEERGGKKRPPRPPPAATKPPYVQKYKDNSIGCSSSGGSSGGGSSSSGFRKSTPPRRPVDPGICTDENFANENWDGDDAPLAGYSGSRAGAGAKSVPQVAQHKAGVRPDDNWLDDDFDD